MRSIITAALALALAAGVARAAPSAKELYEQGLEHYQRAEYDQAIAAWTQANAIAPRPLLLFNLGQAHRLKGDCVEALRLYERYRKAHSEPPNAAELEAAEALCKEAAPPPTATTTRPLGTTPTPDPTAATAPARGDRIGPIAEPDRPAASGRGMRIAGIATAGAGIVLVGAGVVFGRRASNAASELEGVTGEWTAALADLEARGARDEKLAIGGTAIGVTAIGVGVVLYVLGLRAPASIEVTPVAGGAGVSWHTGF